MFHTSVGSQLSPAFQGYEKIVFQSSTHENAIDGSGTEYVIAVFVLYFLYEER